MSSSSHEMLMSSNGSSREAAKKIGNEIVHMAQIQSSKNYTCLPVGSSGPQLPHHQQLNPPQHYAGVNNSTPYMTQSDNMMMMPSGASYEQQQMYGSTNPSYNDSNGYSRMIPSGPQQAIQHHQQQQQQQQYYNSYNR